VRVPEIARVVVLAQVLDVDPDHRDIARCALRRDLAPRHERRIEQLAVGERHPVARLQGDGRASDKQARQRRRPEAAQ
jgi:hypothetical protein